MELSTNSFATVYSSQGVNSTGATFSGLTSGTTFSAQVQAVTQFGAATNFSFMTSTQTLPDVPPNLSGLALGVSSISWTWSVSNGAYGYNLFSATGAFLGTTASTSFIETALSTNAAYGTCVAAFDGSGQGPLACPSSVYTLAARPGQPFFAFVGVNSFQMNWDASGNPSYTQYRAQISTDYFVTVYSSEALSLPPAYFGSLTPGTTFGAEVQAINESGVATNFSRVVLRPRLFGAPQAPTTTA